MDWELWSDAQWFGLAACAPGRLRVPCGERLGDQQSIAWTRSPQVSMLQQQFRHLAVFEKDSTGTQFRRCEHRASRMSSDRDVQEGLVSGIEPI